jgi:hypothetical protein
MRYGVREVELSHSIAVPFHSRWRCVMRRRVEYIRYGPDCVDPDVVRKRERRIHYIEVFLVVGILVLGYLTIMRFG